MHPWCPFGSTTYVINPRFMSQEFIPCGVKGPGLVSTSPASTSRSFLQGAVRREGTSSSTVPPPPPLPLNTHSEDERRETTVEGNMKYLGGVSIHIRLDVERGMGEH